MKLKKWTALLILAVFFLFLLPAHAEELPRLVDETGLFTAEESAEITEALQEATEKTGMDVIVYIPRTLGGKTATDCADDYYDDNGYAKDGILFLFCLEERDWAISTSGEGIPAFTDYGQEQMMSVIRPYLSEGDYAEALLRFAEYAEDYVEAYRDGTPYDVDQPAFGDEPPVDFVTSKPSFNWFSKILISLVIGLIFGFAVTGVMRSKLKSVRQQNAATVYVDANSLNITDRNEFFLYSTVSRVVRSDNSSSGSGGSSTHTSSSGSVHGGSSGKF